MVIFALHNLSYLITEGTEIKKSTLSGKIADYVALSKLRLSSLVVFSAVLGYLIAPGRVEIMQIVWLVLGGFLVTASSNGLNQVIEREVDSQMDRTKNRPIATGRMTVAEGIIVSVFVGILGLFMLWQINFLSSVLGLLSLFMYVVLYTPLKGKTPLAVFVGAFPGSFPPMLGYVAATNAFGPEAGALFAVQFFWQFPHFWSLAWRLHDDYQKGGYALLPSLGGRDKKSAFQIFWFTIFMIPVGIIPWTFQMTGIVSAILVSICGLMLLIPAYRLYKTLDDKHANRLMFSSFAYLPVVLIIYLLDKL